MRTQQIGRIVVADSHPLERLGMAAVVKSVFHCESLDFATGRGELERLLKLSPNLLLLDFELPGLSESEIHQIRADYPSTRIVIISSDCSPQAVLAILGCGVHGFIPKSLNQPDMVAALRQVAAGYVYVPHLVCDVHSDLSAGTARSSQAAARELTHRQQQVLKLACQGKSNKEIGRELEITESTVKVHISAAFRAIGASNRLSAAALFRHWQDPQASLPLLN